MTPKQREKEIEKRRFHRLTQIESCTEARFGKNLTALQINTLLWRARLSFDASQMEVGDAFLELVPDHIRALFICEYFSEREST